MFQEEAGTQRGLLSTALRGRGALVTPAPGAAAAPAGAVATVVRRDKPGTGPASLVCLNYVKILVCLVLLLCCHPSWSRDFHIKENVTEG